ncbi:WecB/TagA/CpsF family glycosyltransferase [Candidatus Omnitrophota bacterium]
MTFFDVCGVHVSVTNLNLAFETFLKWIAAKEKQYVCVAPVATIVDCQRDEAYRRIVNQAGMVTPDGMPVVWLGRRAGHPQVARTYGPDLMTLISDLGRQKNLKHYFYGGSAATLDLLEQRLRDQFPQIHIVGKFAPEIKDVGVQEETTRLVQINEAAPDILWVGLGSPKQDIWMAQHRDLLDVPVMVGVGAAFDFLAGVKPQAPKWMQRSGLEWLFRFCCEPKRLWRRYLIGNSFFIYLLCKQFLFSKKKEANT